MLGLQELKKYAFPGNNCPSFFFFPVAEGGTDSCFLIAKMCLPLCDFLGRSLPGSSVHGTLQARVLEWVAISSPSVSSRPRDRTPVFYVTCFDRWVLYH